VLSPSNLMNNILFMMNNILSDGILSDGEWASRRGRSCFSFFEGVIQKNKMVISVLIVLY